MYIYVLKREAGYDEVDGIVVIAANSNQARLIASRNHAHESGDVWLSPKSSSCHSIGRSETIKPKVILRSVIEG
jgi:hypothetical protein